MAKRRHAGHRAAGRSTNGPDENRVPEPTSKNQSLRSGLQPTSPATVRSTGPTIAPDSDVTDETAFSPTRRSNAPMSYSGRRRASERPGPTLPAIAQPGSSVPTPSVFEVAAYASLAAIIAVAILIVNKRPWWNMVLVLIGVVAMIGVLLLVSSRSGPIDARQSPQGRRRKA